MKKIMVLGILMFSFFAHSQACVPAGNETWDCETKITNVTAIWDVKLCPKHGSPIPGYACHNVTSEICTEQKSKRIVTKNIATFNGQCVDAPYRCE
jgi:hypothetical protein